MSENLISTIESLGIVPVIVLKDATKAERLAKALLDGGIPCIEVTFRTDAAEESIKRICKAYPEMICGAGTVLSIAQAERAINAGARFIVSPGLDETVVKWCQERDIPVFPGVCTASEVQKAIGLGLKVLKFFPAESSGGVKMIKDLCGPFPGVKFMTTGGISMANLAEYAASPNVVAIGGSWMAKADMIENEDWDTITALCKQAMCAIHGFSIAHVGLNTESAEAAQQVADRFATFGLTKKVGNSSTFMNTDIEIMHTMFRGHYGHIGFKTFNVQRALAYLKNFGFTADESSIKYDAKGKIKFAYLNEEIGGFAIHLVQA